MNQQTRLQKFAQICTIVSAICALANLGLTVDRYFKESHYQNQTAICIAEKYPIE